MNNLEYQYLGRICRGTIDDVSPLAQTNSSTTVAEFRCDVQRDASGYQSSGGTLIFLYNVYCDALDIEIKAGDIFSCDMPMTGIVVSVWKHSLGWELKIKDSTVL